MGRRWPFVLALAVVAAGVTGYLVLHGASTSTPGATGRATPTGSASIAASQTPQPTPTSDGQVKPPMRGLVLERSTMPPAADAGLIGGIVATVPWADLQSAPGSQLPTGNAIDQAISVAKAFNAAHPATPIYVKVRIIAGIGAPMWAKTLDGFRPVKVTNTASGQSGTVGPFWTAAYAAAYADLQAKLAVRYDAEPLVRDVTVSQCMTVFAEPFQRDEDFTGFYAQGYTVAADQACLRQQIDAHRIWKHTHQSLSFNPYRPWQLDQSGGISQSLMSEDFVLQEMRYCRTALGALCTLENNSIRFSFIGMQSAAAQAAPQARQYAVMYRAIASMGPAITFQTAGPRTVGNLPATVRWAVSLGANSVEIGQMYDAAQMQTDNAALLANPTGTG